MSEPSVRLVDDPHLVGPGARAWLESQGVHTNVAATILAGELAGPRRYDDQSWALVEDAGEFVGVAVQTAPHDALVPPIGATAAAAVAHAWHAVGRPRPGGGARGRRGPPPPAAPRPPAPPRGWGEPPPRGERPPAAGRTSQVP